MTRAQIGLMQNGILIASASAGTGHVRAAEALRTALRERDPQLHVEHIDVLELAPSWVRAAYRDGFELLAARAPGVWREIYHLTDGPGPDAPRWGAFAQKLLFRELESVLRARRWDAVVATHFLPAQLMGERRDAPPVSLAITDFGLHRYWAQRGVSRYFVATDELAGAVRARVRGARVEATGIPVRTDLMEAPTRAEAVAALALDARQRTILVMGGGLGIGVTGLALAARASGAMQVIALCGRSDAALASLRGVPGVRAVGYVDDVRPYLAAADIVVTKPGGITTSEALALGRPLVLASPIPGHEEDNRSFVVRAGAGISADSPEDVAAAVRMLSDRPALRSRMAHAARRIGRPHAAWHIVSSILFDMNLKEAA